MVRRSAAWLCDRGGDGGQPRGCGLCRHSDPGSAATDGCRSGAGLGRVRDDSDGCGGFLRLPRACGDMAAMSDLTQIKAEARKAAFARRKAAHQMAAPGAA